MTTPQRIVVEGRECEFKHGDNGWWITDGAGGAKSQYLSRSNKGWGNTTGGDDGFWPTEAAAIEFAKSHADQSLEDVLETIGRAGFPADQPASGPNPDAREQQFREYLESAGPDHDWPLPISGIVAMAQQLFAPAPDVANVDVEAIIVGDGVRKLPEGIWIEYGATEPVRLVDVGRTAWKDTIYVRAPERAAILRQHLEGKA